MLGEFSQERWRELETLADQAPACKLWVHPLWAAAVRDGLIPEVAYPGGWDGRQHGRVVMRWSLAPVGSSDVPIELPGWRSTDG